MAIDSERYSGHTDHELIDLLKADDHRAFTEIYDRYWKLLYNAAYQACRNRDNSLDICQTVFVWLWANRSVITIKTSLKGYLFTAVKYKVSNLIQSGKIRGTLVEDLSGVDLQTHQQNELEIKELNNFISQLINELPLKSRQVFLMSREEQLSHKEIAEQMGIAEKTVDEHIYRALRKLRKSLGDFASLLLLH